MAIFIENVLDVHTLEAISEALAEPSLFEEGKKTAGSTAKKVKNNLQSDVNNSLVKGAIRQVEKALFSNPAFVSAAQPLKCAKIIFNRYETGMGYGEHVDDAFINGTRTDLSFTLFLSEPESYQGGELILKKADGDESIKLPSGSLYLYPSTSVHYVAPVTSGSRLAAVGWIQSRVRLEEHRTVLFDLVSALKQLPDSPENNTSRLKLLQVQSNLQRLWSD
jgi:PKHD-type hydroxylase